LPKKVLTTESAVDTEFEVIKVTLDYLFPCSLDFSDCSPLRFFFGSGMPVQLNVKSTVQVDLMNGCSQLQRSLSF